MLNDWGKNLTVRENKNYCIVMGSCGKIYFSYSGKKIHTHIWRVPWVVEWTLANLFSHPLGWPGRVTRQGGGWESGSFSRILLSVSFVFNCLLWLWAHLHIILLFLATGFSNVRRTIVIWMTHITCPLFSHFGKSVKETGLFWINNNG